ncbi:MAG: hypothetical protein CBB60_004135 [Armatimonadetes bacterium Cent15-Ar3]|nr:MAG: hypothetical protein CBB60_004135 [Armatimonadetes bacterium Cent15-Ar3]
MDLLRVVLAVPDRADLAKVAPEDLEDLDKADRDSSSECHAVHNFFDILMFRKNSRSLTSR